MRWNLSVVNVIFVSRLYVFVQKLLKEINAIVKFSKWDHFKDWSQLLLGSWRNSWFQLFNLCVCEMIKHFHEGVMRVWHTTKPSPCTFMSLFHLTNQQVWKPVSEQTAPYKIYNLYSKPIFYMNYKIFL
jgi:hypothetical protein